NISQDGEIEPAKASAESQKAIIDEEQIAGAIRTPAREVSIPSEETIRSSAPQTKRRGRPPGTKNKAKAPQPQETQSERSEAGISSSQRGGQTASAMTPAPPVGSTADGQAEYLQS